MATRCCCPPDREVISGFVTLETDNLQHFRDTPVDFVFGLLGNSQAKGDVVIHIQMGKQGISLENRIDLPFVSGDVIHARTVEKHIAGGRRQKPADDSESCGFPAAGWAQKGQKFVVVDIEIDVV